MIARDKALGEQNLAFVVLLESREGVFALEFERNHEVGGERSRELPGRYGGVAAVGAGGDGDGAVRDQLGAAGGTNVARILTEHLGFAGRCSLRRRGRRVCLGISLCLAFTIESLNFCHLEARIAVIACQLLLCARKMQRSATRGALIVDALVCHDRSFPVVALCARYAPMAPPQYSQRPLASGMVVAPQKGHVTAVLGA